MIRLVALAAIALAVAAGEAQAAGLRIVVVPGLELADLEALQHRGAVGLLVPGAGRQTSAALAEASLVRGKVVNSARGAASGPVLVPFEIRSAPPAGPAIVLALPLGERHTNDRRYPIAVLGDGYRGLLTSQSTRVAGLVSIGDVAPTTLGRKDRLRWRAEPDAAAQVAALDRRIDDHRAVRLPAMLLTLGLTALLALLFPRAGLLGFPAALGANLALGAAGVTSSWVVLLTIGLAVAGGAPLGAIVLRSPVALGAAMAATLTAYLVGFAVDGSWIAFSPLGPEQNSRFYGLTNLLETLMLVPAFAGAALLWRRLGFAAVAGIAALSLVTVAGNRFGADGGGAIVLAVAYCVLVVGLARAPRRALAVALPIAAALVVAFVAIDAATGASTHVTHAFEDGPVGLLGDLGDRAVLSYDNAVSNWGSGLGVAASLAGLALLALRAFRHGLAIEGRALLTAFLVAIATSLVVNDSPLDVSLVGLAGFWALYCYERYESRRNDGVSSTSWRMLPVCRP
jgi:hypothetical protein